MTKKELAKFRKRKVRIMKLWESGLPQAEIARRMSMKRQRVNQIIWGK